MEISALVRIVNQPHPLLPAVGREFSAQGWRSGETAREALLRAGLDPHLEIVILINDRTLAVDEWDSVCPQPGDMVHAVAALSGGGGGGSNPLKIILSIAVMVLAWQLGPMLGAQLGGFASTGAMGAAGSVGALGLSGAAWGAIGSGLITLAGNLVVGAIFKPSSGALTAVNGSSAAASPTYSLSGGSNSVRPYSPMQVVMGTHRVFPDYGAKPYTELRGDDQYLYQLFNFGLSDVQLSDLHIGDSPLSNYDDVTLQWSDGAGNLPGFPGNVDSDNGAELVRGEDWVVRTSAIDTVRLSIDVEGSAYYSGNSGLVACTVRIEAEYKPVSDTWWKPLTSSTQVTYTTGYWSLRTTEVYYYQGTDSDSYSETKVIQHAYAQSGHAEGEAQQIGLTWWGAPMFGYWTWASFSDGFASDGPQPIYTAVSYVDVPHGASQTPQRRTFSLAVAKGIYDVRVRLTSARSTQGEIASGDSRGGYSYRFSTLRSYQEDAANYAGQKRLGMIIKASGQLSGVVERLSAIASASTVDYSDGYNSGRWRPTSNPAWWYLDFARGRKNPFGEQMYGCHLADSQIDFAAIAAWASFCDRERLTLNMVIDSPQSAQDTLNDIARCGLASPSWASGKLGVVWDRRDASPVAAFGMSNILKGSFSVKYVTENLADEIVVSYVDSEREWTPDEVRVTVPGVNMPQRSSTVEIKGCTTGAAAAKYARIQAAAQVYRSRMISWAADFEGFVCQRGDVVILQHDLTQWGYSGRLVTVAGSTVTLDRTVPRSGGVDYLMLVQPDGDMQTFSIAAGSGESGTLVLPSAPAMQPDMLTLDHRWFFSPLPTPGKKVKIVSVKPVSSSRIQIVATDEDPAFYAAWDGVWNPPARQTLLRNEVPRILDMKLSESLVMSGTGSVTNRVTASFLLSAKHDSILVRYHVGDGPWTRATLSGNTLVFDTDFTGALEIEANAILGFALGPRYNGRGTIAGKTVRPGDVLDFSIAVTGTIAFLSFSVSTELDVLNGGQIRIRHSSATSGATWNNSSDLLSAAPGSSLIVPLLAGTYLAKWVDSGGRDSVNAALISSEITAALIALNVIDTLDDGASWPGTKTDTVYDGLLNGVKLDGASRIDSLGALVDTWAALDTMGGIISQGTYQIADSIDLGRVVTSRITAALDIEPFSIVDLIDSRNDVADAWIDIDGGDLSIARAYIEVSTSDDNIAWSSWQRFAAGEWTCRALRARLVLQSSLEYINIVVHSASIRIDMPDRIEAGNDIASGAGLYAVTYGTAFQAAPALAIAAQGLATGDYYSITAKSVTGFSITFRNAAGTAISRTFDYLSKGY